uniref:Testis-expressed sequence 11 protein n=1 Tax=Nannospalax galili TaxID=1026970 RepID=A0A8C6RQT3_NANGA
AKEAIIEVERYDPMNSITQLCVFKIAVMEGNPHRALQAITTLKTLTSERLNNRDLLESEKSPTLFLNLATQFALQYRQRIVAERGLEYLSQVSEDIKETLAALKCLFHLIIPEVCHMPESENKMKQMDRLLIYLNTALLRFAQPFVEEPSILNFRICEADWFRKTAWNLALQSGKHPLRMKEFFMISYKLSLFCPSDQNLLISQKTCLLISAAVDLDQGRRAATTYEQAMLLNQSFEKINKCKHICSLLKQEGNSSHRKCRALLLLYEFEIKSKMHDPSLGSFLQSMWKIPDLERTTLERIAVLAMDKPAHYPTVAQEALKRLLVIHKSKNPMDTLNYSLCTHNLIDLSLLYGVSSTVDCPINEIWCHFRDALRVIAHTDGYPEREILWLMIKSWDIGILMYNWNNFEASEEWASMTLNFLDHLGSLKIHYETQVNLVFIELMEAIIKKKKYGSSEMPQRLEALIALPEDPNLVPSTMMSDHNPQ